MNYFCRAKKERIHVTLHFLQCSVRFPPNSQDDSESTPQLSVHSDTHHLPSGQLLVTLTWWWLLYMYSCTDTRTAGHYSSYITLREQTPHKPSSNLCIVCGYMCVHAILVVFVCAIVYCVFGYTLLWLLYVLFSTKCGLYVITESLFNCCPSSSFFETLLCSFANSRKEHIEGLNWGELEQASHLWVGWWWRWIRWSVYML